MLIQGHPDLEGRVPAIGDVVLRTVAQSLAATLRVGDGVIRYGSDKFVSILPDVPLAPAMRIAERARRITAEQVLMHEGQRLAVSVTIGVAERNANEPREQLIERARMAVVRARLSSRDTVRQADPALRR